MNSNKQLLLKKYFASTLSDQEQIEMENMIARGIIQMEELQDQEFESYFERQNNVEPDARMDGRFFEMIAAHKVQPKRKIISMPRIVSVAAGVLLLLGAFWVGRLNMQKPSSKVNDQPSLATEFGQR